MSAELSKKTGGGQTEPLIIGNLNDLNFPTSGFVLILKAEKISVNGYDKVEFLISANPGAVGSA